MKIPEPIIDPATTMVASKTPSSRTKPAGVDAEEVAGGELPGGRASGVIAS
jgi:hypothetical protein